MRRAWGIGDNGVKRAWGVEKGDKARENRLPSLDYRQNLEELRIMTKNLMIKSSLQTAEASPT